MRCWNRGASYLGHKQIEEAIQEELTRRFPLDQVPVNIDVVGGQATTYVTVQVTNFEAGIQVFEKAFPAEFVGSACPTMAAAIEAAERVVSRLRETGRLPRA